MGVTPSPPSSQGEPQGGQPVPRPGGPAPVFALEDTAELWPLGRRETSEGSGTSARFHPLFLPPQACAVTCPVGISFIIFPLNLINPHPVMNLEISIKHIVTNHRAGGSWRLLTAAQAAWSSSGPGHRPRRRGSGGSCRTVPSGGGAARAGCSAAPPAGSPPTRGRGAGPDAHVSCPRSCARSLLPACADTPNLQPWPHLPGPSPPSRSVSGPFSLWLPSHLPWQGSAQRCQWPTGARANRFPARRPASGERPPCPRLLALACPACRPLLPN